MNCNTFIMPKDSVLLYSCMYSWLNWLFFGGRRGGNRKKNYLHLGGGGSWKKWLGGGVGGHAIFRMTVQKIPPAPLPRKKWTVPKVFRSTAWLSTDWVRNYLLTSARQLITFRPDLYRVLIARERYIQNPFHVKKCKNVRLKFLSKVVRLMFFSIFRTNM